MSRRRTWLSVGAWPIAAVATFAVGVGVGRARDDGNDRVVGATEETATTSSAVARTAPPSTVAPPNSLPVPGPPLPFTTLDEVLYPADIAELRATLDQFGMPAWWPLPDTVAPSTAPYSTVQMMVARDTIQRLDSGDRSNGSWETTWLVDPPDLAAAEAAFLSKIPTDRYDVAAGTATRSEVIENDRITVKYVFYVIDQSVPDPLALSLKDTIDPASGVRIGTLVNITSGVSADEVTAPVPVGTSLARQFLGHAPVAPEMLWTSTSVGVEGGLSLYGDFIFEPSGRFSAQWEIDDDDVDAVIAFLSEPTNFTGDLKVATAGEFLTDDWWVEDVGYQGLDGQYSLLTGDPGSSGSAFVNLEFKLR